MIGYDCRTSGGRLHLLNDIGKIPLADTTLIEEPSDSEREDDGQLLLSLMLRRINLNNLNCLSRTVDSDVVSQKTSESNLSANEAASNEGKGQRDFKILFQNKMIGKHLIHLVAPTVQDKGAWMSDISQCIDNIHLHTMLSPITDRGSSGSNKSEIFVMISF